MNFAIHNVAAVLPDRVVENASVVVRDGVIDDIVAGGPIPTGSVDGRGAWCLPGLVDSHSDGLEKERLPRPGVELPWDFALRSYEGRVRAAGVTTVFHGARFGSGGAGSGTPVLANELCDAVEELAASADALVDHRILYRLDAREADGLVALQKRLPSRVDPSRPMVSFEDHTPGQGQYTDRKAFERYVAGTMSLSPEAARDHVDEVLAERDALLANRHAALPWLTEQASEGGIRLLAHDPATPAEVDEACTWSAAIGEFPTTVEAAQRARERGLRTVCGAPNVLRGQSHSGNVSAVELISRGLCDGLSSDYMPAALLGAVGVLVDQGVCSLPAAVSLVTSGPAGTVGLEDRGRLVPGDRGDMVLATFRGRLPTVHAVLRPEDLSAR